MPALAQKSVASTFTARTSIDPSPVSGLYTYWNESATSQISLPEACTVGGALATATHGPLKHAYGGLRDYCTGIRYVTTDGKLAKAGGRVVKNVAGYDMMKLLIGSYGTVAEPCNYLEKFPTPLDYFYQARRFTLAESYYQSVANPYQGIMIAEPLAAPFALVGRGGWVGLASNAVLSGTMMSAMRRGLTPARIFCTNSANSA